MYTTYFILSGFLVFATLIPAIDNQHWFFRGFEFGKVQFLVLKVVVFFAALFTLSFTSWVWTMQAILLACIGYNAAILIRYSPLYKVKDLSNYNEGSNCVTLISANVYQFNRQYDRFIALIRNHKPDIFLTMESNQDWEDALTVLEDEYPYHCKVALENTYGMHLYTKLKMTKSQVHYFVADDLPSIEANLQTQDGYKFTLFGVHPPPPSPTEEENSKERDGELLSVAKKIRSDRHTTIVVGDFNTVAWSKPSILFRKTSETIDPRHGRGLYSTFHAKYWLLRFPIDQLYHTPNVFIKDLKVLPEFGSDHLPLYSEFCINHHDDSQEELVEELEKGEMQEVNEIIADGIAEMSDRPEVAVENGFSTGENPAALT